MQCVLDETTILVNGERLVLDAAGALFWPAESTLVFADIHFEKGSSYAERGVFLPPYDTRTMLRRIRATLAHRKPKRVIALGDSFHDRRAADRLDDSERRALREFSEQTEWIWVAGNHDPIPPTWLGGSIAPEVEIAGLMFRHEPSPGPTAGEIAGHLHPCKTVTRRGRGLRLRCFVSDGYRLLLPAFGAYAGGLDVGDEAIASLFNGDCLAYVLGTRRVYAVATTKTSHRLWKKSTSDFAAQ